VELPTPVLLTIGGIMGALTNVALGPKAILLPRRVGGCIHLGFLAQLIVSIGVANAVGHDLQSAFLSALCGMSLMRSVKRRLETAFQGLAGEFEEASDE
jgi:hypothetical protein